MFFVSCKKLQNSKWQKECVTFEWNNESISFLRAGTKARVGTKARAETKAENTFEALSTKSNEDSNIFMLLLL